MTFYRNVMRKKLLLLQQLIVIKVLLAHLLRKKGHRMKIPLEKGQGGTEDAS